MKQVNIAKVLEVVHDIYYEIHVTDYGYMVEPPNFKLKFSLLIIWMLRNGTSSMSVTGRAAASASGNAQVSSRYETNFRPELEKTLMHLLFQNIMWRYNRGRSSGNVMRSRARRRE